MQILSQDMMMTKKRKFIFLTSIPDKNDDEPVKQ